MKINRFLGTAFNFVLKTKRNVNLLLLTVLSCFITKVVALKVLKKVALNQ